MRRTFAIIFAAAALATAPLTVVAQGMGPGMGPGGGPGRMGTGPCAQGNNTTQCWRTQNPEKHAACWSKANDNGLRGPARRSFMMDCMTK